SQRCDDSTSQLPHFFLHIAHNLINPPAALKQQALQPLPNNLSTKPPTAIVGKCALLFKLVEENP
ncbi:hypothetical protein, partial [Pseudomonas tolaasii]|uniref:hypothetical protein n=1 Tax=Pseudomonas tolaasii TaxID=29442 RepID=UPI001E5FA4BC